MDKEELENYGNLIGGEVPDKQEPGFSITGLINQDLRETERQSRAEESNDSFRASGMGSCKLKRYWKRSGKQGEPIDDRGLRVFAAGHVFHEWIQNKTKKYGKSIMSEIDMEYKNPNTGKVLATGHLDDLIDHNGHYILYDYKSMHSQGFHYLKGGAKPQHRRQIVTYMLMVQQMFPEKFSELTDLRVLYISKDDLCTLELSVRPTSELVNSVLNELYEINDSFEKQIEPIAEPEEEWECKYCAYKLVCPRGKNKIVEQGQIEEKSGNKKSIKL